MKILAINGGGSLGYMVLCYLENIEKEFKINIYDHFDFFSGISTGSIINGGLASKISVTELKELYRENMPKLFHRRWLMDYRQYFESYFKLDILVELLNGIKFKPAKNMMTSYVKLTGDRIDTLFYKSWRDNNKLSITNSIIASSTAPTFFDPFVVNGDAYIDGSIANTNISMCSVIEGIKLGNKIEDIKLLNIRCNEFSSLPLDKAKNLGGLLSWSILSYIMIASTDDITMHQTKTLLGDNYKVISPRDMTQSPSSLDFGKMENCAKEMLKDSFEDIKIFLN